jgi:hypothetical protein
MKRDSNGLLIIPEHFSAKAHREMMARLARMTEEERNQFIFELNVKVGIYTPDGELTEQYKDTPEPTSKTA